MHKVVIIGQGYVGLNLSVVTSKVGFRTIGFDINPVVVESLNSGISHIEGISHELLQDLIEDSDLRFSSNPSDLRDADIVVIAVPTGLMKNGEPDLSNLRSAVNLITLHLNRPALVINESTSFPGTLHEEVVKPIRHFTDIEHLFASSPERVDPANPKWNLENTPRLVAGENVEALTKAVEFYSTFCKSVISVNRPEEAEAAKLLENSFRLVNISFINEFSTILIKMGIDPTAVIEAAATKPYGFMKFLPSAGAGGHCIPVDPVYFQMKAEEYSKPSLLIQKSVEINDSMARYITEAVKRDHNDSLNGLTVMIVGVAYKSNVSDVRESRSSILYQDLVAEGANVTWHDPLVAKWENSESSPLTNSDISILVVQHDGFDYANLELSSYVFDVSKLQGRKVNLTLEKDSHLL